jgi:hypothetical protein
MGCKASDRSQTASCLRSSKMRLPVELVDEILSHLPSDDKQSLRKYSLVSKLWLQPSRRLLFVHIVLHAGNYQSWLKNISPTNAGLLHHIRSLTLSLRTPYIHGGIFILRDYLPSLCQLQALTLSNTDIEPVIPEHLDLFSAFQHTLSSLTLMQVSITWSAFVTLVGFFPGLRNFCLRRLSFEVDDRPVPQTPHVLRGGLLLELPPTKDSGGSFIDLFPGLRQEYEELVIFGAYNHRLVAVVEANLKSLRIGDCERTSLHTVCNSELNH